jgi:hypothetical protein
MRLRLKTIISLLIILIIITPSICFAKTARYKYIHVKRSYAQKSLKHKQENRGSIKRSLEAKHEFWKLSGYPHGRKGYVVDHVIPLACGGADRPSNMQWQTIASGKAKDKWERNGCGKTR